MIKFFDFGTGKNYATYTVDEYLNAFKNMFAEYGLNDYTYDEDALIASINSLIKLKEILEDEQAVLIRVFWDIDKKQIFVTPAHIV